MSGRFHFWFCLFFEGEQAMEEQRETETEKSQHYGAGCVRVAGGTSGKADDKNILQEVFS